MHFVVQLTLVYVLITADVANKQLTKNNIWKLTLLMSLDLNANI